MVVLQRFGHVVRPLESVEELEDLVTVGQRTDESREDGTALEEFSLDFSPNPMSAS